MTHRAARRRFCPRRSCVSLRKVNKPRLSIGEHFSNVRANGAGKRNESLPSTCTPIGSRAPQSVSSNARDRAEDVSAEKNSVDRSMRTLLPTRAISKTELSQAPAHSTAQEETGVGLGYRPSVPLSFDRPECPSNDRILRSGRERRGFVVVVRPAC